MTGEPLSRLDPDIASLLRDVEPYPEPPRGAQARVADALASRIAAFDANPSHDASSDVGAPPVPTPSGIVALAARPLRTIAGTFLVGAMVGATVHAVLRPPRERVVYVEKPAPVAPQATPPIEPDRSAPTVAVPPSTTAPRVAQPALAPVPSVRRAPSSQERPEKNEKGSPRGASDLGAEQALLDLARRAHAQGRTDEALAPLDRHAQRYPEGILAEEREALAVNVLVSLGRYADARARADRFFQRYPGSLLRGSVEAALGAIPKSSRE